jgi:RNA polymerase sigma factor for flagellar operon FliA
MTPREPAGATPTPELWERYRASGDAALRRELLDRYIGLVHHHAREMIRRTHELELDELVSSGTVGLIQALEGFDPGRGLAFSTYALPRIRGAMLDELRRYDWAPRSVRSRSRQIEKARDRLRQRHGAEPGHEQIAAELGVDLETYWKWDKDAESRSRIALDARETPDGDPAPLHEALADDNAPAPDARLLEREMLGEVRDAFDELPERDRLVLSLSYYEELSLRQIGEVLHITESRVSQIRTRALKRLRDALREREAA